MTNDEKVRIDATIGEMGTAIMRTHARSADLAAECASLKAQLDAANAKIAELAPKPELKAVE